MDFLRNYFVVLLALILVFVLNVSFTLGDSRLTPAYDFGKYKVLSAKDTVLVLQCNVTDTSPSSSSNRSIRWSKEGKPIKSVTIDKKEIEVSEGKLTIKRPSWSDVGNYSCSLYGPNGTELLNKADIYVIAQPYVKIEHSDLTFIEGEELKIECDIYGKPTPDVQWKFGNETYDVNTSGGAVKINVKATEDPNVIKSEFIIEHAKMDNRGVYTCIAINEASLNSDVSKDACNARIKDRYAALWPFLGICVEVVVLCAIIFIYEKKRNKAELEESDTDQSPEQAQGGDRPQKRGGKIFVPLEDPSAKVTTSPLPRSETDIPKTPTQSQNYLPSQKSEPDQSESTKEDNLQKDNFLKVVNIGIPCLDFKNPKPYPVEYPESSKVLSVQMQLKSCKFSGKTHLITERNQFGKENN